ncbi:MULTISPECIES: cyclic nucleotide-binding domain-containing protein [unclassified Streptomyces]|uniref:cyclic nucleotide-binding domain-containing protein n=1 Tax=unclassified Streptomyces TaxID=2593676 RepID=UPI002E37A45B|nr:cyclic nucleotide-binding domain-containing protein [Streptomyces sp. NBC_01716]
MTMTLLNALPGQGREHLMEFSRPVSFAAGTRIFEDRDPADRFWVIRTGAVNLDLHRRARNTGTLEMLGHGDLLGWSWLVPPYTWRLGAEAFSMVRADEFDARAVRALCDEDPVLGLALTRRVLEVVADRLQATRIRLLGMYAPQGSEARLSIE